MGAQVLGLRVGCVSTKAYGGDISRDWSPAPSPCVYATLPNQSLKLHCLGGRPHVSTEMEMNSF